MSFIGIICKDLHRHFIGGLHRMKGGASKKISQAAVESGFTVATVGDYVNIGRAYLTIGTATATTYRRNLLAILPS